MTSLRTRVVEAGARIVVDTEACIAGWGPCNESYGFSHSCKKREGHDGFHICAICGDRRKLRQNR